MYYFLKKTGELVKRKKIPAKKAPLEKKYGLYIRIALGDRKDKSFFVFKNQVKHIEADTLLSNFEIECMKKCHLCPDSWRQLCATIKASRENNYPRDWFSVLRREKIEKPNIETDGHKDTTSAGNVEGINILNMMSGLFKSLGQTNNDEANSSSVPTIIVLETDPDSFGRKKGSDYKNAKKSAHIIKFQSFVEGTTELQETVDFITRFDLHNHKNDATLYIPANSTFDFDGPLQQVCLKNADPFRDTLSLLTWLLAEIKANENYLSSPYTLQDIGIQDIKKIEETKYSVSLLY